MMNHVFVLMFLSLFAVTLSRDLQKRYANTESDGALLDAFARALEESKLDSNNNDQLQEVRKNLMKRWWGIAPPIIHSELTLQDTLARALEEGKLDNNDLVQEVRQNLRKRWWGIAPP